MIGHGQFQDAQEADGFDVSSRRHFQKVKYPRRFIIALLRKEQRKDTMGVRNPRHY